MERSPSTGKGARGGIGERAIVMLKSVADREYAAKRINDAALAIPCGA